MQELSAAEAALQKPAEPGIFVIIFLGSSL